MARHFTLGAVASGLIPRVARAPHARLFVLVWLLAASQLFAQSAAEPVEKQSLFQRTVYQLQESAPDERSGFAIAALSEMSTVYMAEADLARSEAARRDGQSRAKLLGWAYEVNQYANQLLLILEDVESGTPVSLLPDPLGPVSIVVAGKEVVLGHPRADQQAAYEQRVLSDFCSHHDCQGMIAPNPLYEEESLPRARIKVYPQWTFTDRGPVCANEGLEVHFGSSRKLAALRAICDELVREVADLADGLSWQWRNGVEIDWDNLSVTATSGKPEHLVRLNEVGDSVLRSLPLLYSSPTLLADIRAYLFWRVQGQESASVRLDASKYESLQPES